MVTFLPFKGYRPSLKGDESIEDRVSPPYDVISGDYLNELQSKPHNVTRLTLMPDPDKRYKGSREQLESWIEDGALVQDDDSFYLYKQTFDDHGVTKVRTGFVGRLKTERYDDGNIIPHEETFSKVKADRLNLLRDMETHLESIFGIFEGFGKDLNDAIAKAAVPLYSFKDDAGVTHEYFRISDKDITDRISKELTDQKMLIADGHHRYETALNYSLENPDDEMKSYVLATLVASDDGGLVIWPTHRLVKSDEISDKSVISKVQKRFETKEVDSADEMMSELKDWEMGLMFRSGRYILARYNGGDDPMWSLDTYVLQELILKDIYKSDEDKATIAYDAEYPSVKKKMDNKEYDLAVILNDPSLDTIWKLSMIGKRMPKKTTFFFPKIWSGFVFYKMA